MHTRTGLAALSPVCLALSLLLLPGSPLAAQDAPTGAPPPPVNPPGAERNPFTWLSEGRAAGGEGERERDEIETDRDSFTPATTTAGRGRLIFESAYSFLDNRGVKETHSFPEAIFRYGVTDWLELRFGANYEVGGAGSEVSGAAGEAEFGEEGRMGGKLERESVVFYGFKARFSRQDGLVPQNALLFQARTPTSGEATDTHFIGTYVFGWQLPNRWKLDAAVRYGTASEKEDRFGVWAPSVVLKVPVGEKLNVHAEYFGLFSRDRAEEFTRHYFSPGVHYLITEDVEVGVRMGWGLNDQTPRYFVNAGLGVRF